MLLQSIAASTTAKIYLDKSSTSKLTSANSRGSPKNNFLLFPITRSPIPSDREQFPIYHLSASASVLSGSMAANMATELGAHEVTRLETFWSESMPEANIGGRGSKEQLHLIEPSIVDSPRRCDRCGQPISLPPRSLIARELREIQSKQRPRPRIGERLRWQLT